jgi:hypothetical protein
MSAPILHVGATVQCAHAGSAMPTSPSPRVTVSGQSVATIASPYAIAGCSLPSNAGGPCVTGQWTIGATRVLVTGQPVVIMTGQAVCAPTGTPLIPVSAQARSLAT